MCQTLSSVQVTQQGMRQVGLWPVQVHVAGRTDAISQTSTSLQRQEEL